MTALIVVVIIGAASIIMAKGAAFLSIGELDMAKTASMGGSAYYSAEACLEEALLNIKRDNAFTADSLAFTLGEISCTLNVIDTASGKEVVTRGNYFGYEKNLRAEIEISDGNPYLLAVY